MSAIPPKIYGTVSHYAIGSLSTSNSIQCVGGSGGKDTYGVGDHGGEDRALGVVPIVLAGDEGDGHDLQQEDGCVQERLRGVMLAAGDDER